MGTSVSQPRLRSIPPVHLGQAVLICRLGVSPVVRVFYSAPLQQLLLKPAAVSAAVYAPAALRAYGYFCVMGTSVSQGAAVSAPAAFT